MAVEDIEKRVRNIVEKNPENGKDMAAYQEAQNELIRINAERQNNLAMARAGSNTDAEVNNTLLQASEISAMNSQGVQQQVETMNPQTQAILGKYGLGQPKVQRTTSRNVKVTPNNITINNNTTNNTTNNVAVPNGGPVQGRTLSVKQQDQGQARFKTWISNAFARQNQQAVAREKEYQRREWSLSRSTNRLMKRIESLGSSISERLDPKRMVSTFGGHLRTLLFLFGTKFLASNWDKILKIGTNLENFFFGEAERDKDGNLTNRGEPGYKKFLKELVAGENGIGSWLIRAFGGKEGVDSLGSAFFKLFWNNDSNSTGKDAGIFNLFLKKIKDWFEEGAQAAKSIELPKNLLSKEPLEALQSLISYFSSVISSLFTGGKALKKSIDESIQRKGDDALRSNDIGGKYRRNNEKEYHKILSPEDLGKLGITDQQIILGGVNKGDLAEGNQFSTHLFSNDLTKDNKLTGTVGSLFRQVNNIGILSRNKDEMSLSGLTMGMRNIDEFMKEDSKKGNNSTGLVLESTSSWGKLGVNSSLVSELRRSGNVKNKEFVYVLDEKSPEEKKEELKYATDPEKEAAKEYANQFIKNEVGARKSIWKIIGGVAGLAGGLILAPATGGASILISAASLASAGITGAWLGSKLAGGVHDIVMDEKLQAALKWAITHDEIKLVKPYTVRLVPKDQVGNRIVLKDKGTLVKEVLDYEGWKKIKESQGMLESDEYGNVISEKNYNLSDEYWRERSKDVYKKIAKKQGIDEDDIPTKTDIDDINFEAGKELDELREEHKKEQLEMWNNSRVKKSVDNFFSSNSNKSSTISDTQRNSDFVRTMREAYAKEFKRLGIDPKYIDVMVAQDAKESTWGTSKLATGKNNFGGIRDGNNGWKEYKDVDDYVRGKLQILSGKRYEGALSESDLDVMMEKIAKSYDPGNSSYKDDWKKTIDTVQKYGQFNKPSTDEIKKLREQGNYALADLASASWPSIESVLRAGGVEGFVVTSKKRNPGQAGKSGNRSYHTTENMAIDIVPVEGQTFEGLKEQMLKSPLVQQYFKDRNFGVLDETSEEVLRRTGGTGPHFHIGPDNSSVKNWLAWNEESQSPISPDGSYPMNNSSLESNFALSYPQFPAPYSSTSIEDYPWKSYASVTPTSYSQITSSGNNLYTLKSPTSDVLFTTSTDNFSGDILSGVKNVNSNLSLIQEGQIVQTKVLGMLADGLSNITINVNSGNNSGSEGGNVPGFTRPPFS